MEYVGFINTSCLTLDQQAIDIFEVTAHVFCKHCASMHYFNRFKNATLAIAVWLATQFVSLSTYGISTTHDSASAEPQSIEMTATESTEEDEPAVKAGADFYVLDRKKLKHGFWSYFVTPVDPLRGTPGKQAMWVKYDPQSPNFLLMANDKDRLAYSTSRPSDAVYVRALRDTKKVKVDDEHFRLLKEKPGWSKKLFGTIDKNMPLTGAKSEEKADDKAEPCPDHPKTKLNKNCPVHEAEDLPPRLESIIKRVAKEQHLAPEVLAGLLHAESKFDFWLENTNARDACGGKLESEKCSRYGWERGIGQIGTELSKEYGIDWHRAIDKPPTCKSPPWTDDCIQQLEAECAKVKGRLKPYNCPHAAIHAAAKRLARGVAEKVELNTKSAHGNRVVDVTKKLNHLRGPEYYRYLVSAYNRGPRIANSFVEYNRRHHGKWPESYGHAWATTREPAMTPSKGTGFQILNGEYVNRCYVFSIVGICDAYPETSLAKQYKDRFANRKAASKPESVAARPAAQSREAPQ